MNTLAIQRYHHGSMLPICSDGKTASCFIIYCEDSGSMDRGLSGAKEIKIQRYNFIDAGYARSSAAFAAYVRRTCLQIAIANLHWLTPTKTPAVSSLEDYQTPAH